MTIRVRALPIAVIFALASNACGGAGDDTALSTPTIDTSSSGVIHVSNAGPTVWAGTNGWRLVLERTVRPAAGSEHAIVQPMGVVADDAGNLYVMEREPPALNVYAPDGTWLRSIGAVGDGPGEFRRSMIGIRGDTLLVQDPVNVRLTKFLTDGTLLGEVPSQCCFRRMRPIQVLDDGSLVLTGPASSGTADRAIFLTQLDGTVADTAPADPTLPADDAAQWQASWQGPQGLMTRSMAIPNQPQAVFEWRGDGTRVMGNTGSYRLVVTGRDLDTLRVITATAPVLTMSETQRDSVYEDAMATARPDWRAELRATTSADDIALTLPAWIGVMPDPSGRLWVGRPGTDGAVASLDVFDPDGVLLGTVASPSPSVLSGTWAGNRLLVAEEDADGFVGIAIYRLDTSY